MATEILIIPITIVFIVVFLIYYQNNKEKQLIKRLSGGFVYGLIFGMPGVSIVVLGVGIVLLLLYPVMYLFDKFENWLNDRH